MDINMPVMDGIQATQQIRDGLNHNDIEKPLIIACTAYSEAYDKDKCILAGANEFINKPVNFD